ncbi:hypothetical protein ACVWWQ_001365 [Rhodanobacter sp. TND4EL1]
MRRLLASLPFALLLSACSPAPSPPSATAQTAPANAALGSPQWYAWVDQTLSVTDSDGHGPDRGSPEWNQAVQRKLGQEAPQSQPGSPEWQQSVDALLRTRAVGPK